MKITFFSNFLTHHQVPFCLEMQKRYGDGFKFVATMKIVEERLKLGYKDMDHDYDFVVRAYESKESYQKAFDLALESDIVIMGSTDSDIYIQERLKQDKLTIRYRERIFKEGIVKSFFNKKKREEIYIKHFKYRKNKNLYIICASAYGANDCAKFNLYKNKVFKWGYFPQNKKHDIDELLEKKEQNEIPYIVWAGRFIEWKHPEQVVNIAKRLKQEGIKFRVTMLGVGELLESIRQSIEKEGLTDYIELVGSVSSDKVMDYMEKANIYLFTSDRQEGWGVVLNESMNSGCAVVANKAIGSVPFLIKDGESGIIAQNEEEFYQGVKRLLADKELRMKVSKNAYKTIDEEWNYITAVDNLQKLFDSIMNNKELEVIDGPASKAEPV